MLEVVWAERKLRDDEIYILIFKLKFSKELDQILFRNCLLPISHILESNMQLLRIGCSHLSNSYYHFFLLFFTHQSKITYNFSQLLN